MDEAVGLLGGRLPARLVCPEDESAAEDRLVLADLLAAARPSRRPSLPPAQKSLRGSPRIDHCSLLPATQSHSERRLLSHERAVATPTGVGWLLQVTSRKECVGVRSCERIGTLDAEGS